MTFNLVCWAWSDDYDTPAKRRKHKLKYPDVMAAFSGTESHPAMDVRDLSAFVADVESTVGPATDGEPYILERYPCAVVYNLAIIRVPELVPRIGDLAGKHGLTSAEC
jgi:hypothetical protein